MGHTIAFVGLGIMGRPMAGHLLRAGHALRVHTRTKRTADEVLRQGARWCDSPADAAKGADFIVTCVPDTPDVKRVLLDGDGAIHGATRGAIVIDHSTISPAGTREIAAELATRGVAMVDAPVSGGDVGAQKGQLSIMAGGDAAAFERAEPVMRAYGKSIIHTGKSGTGQATKLVNQILVGINLLGVSEALIFAQKNDLNLATTLEAVGGGAAASWQLANLGPKMVAGDFKPGFMIDMIQKDLRLLLQSAEDAQISLPAASLVHQLFTAAQAAGHGRDGTQALFTVLQKLASLH